ncbi:MAG: heterodisulfide reductase-related iron-sulfur binding cluster [Candidatus Bathyarchaeia archaeon]
MNQSPVVKVRVFRYHKGMDKPIYETYEVPRLPKMTVLDALEYITEVLGSDIAYRSSCGIMRCGQCGVLVNGKAVLACKHMIDADEITIEPLPNFPVLKDLVVDFSQARNKLQKILHFLREKPSDFPEPINDEEMKKVREFSQCIECRVCMSICPIMKGYREWLGPTFYAWVSRFNMDPRDTAKNVRLEKIRDELWYCAACSACKVFCPWEVPIWDGINELRSVVVETGFMPKTLKDALTNTLNYGNPWGVHGKRDQWVEGIKVKRLPNERAEVLYFVGCAASYETRAQSLARSAIKIFERAHVDFGILNNETCCGEPALRLGERGLFELLASENIKNFKECKVQTIVTTCPHAYDIFVKEYPKLGSSFTVKHYTQFISDLIDKNKLKITKRLDKIVTYHDPCFLGRHNGVYEAPRKILESIPGLKLIEMPRNKENSFCCGGGGGRMWFEESPMKVKERPCVTRSKEAASINPNIIVTACPFCLINLEDGIKVIEKENEIQVLDLMELLATVV